MKNPENLAKIPFILSSAAGIYPGSFPNVTALLWGLMMFIF
jgi:hypothetical protein